LLEHYCHDCVIHRRTINVLYPQLSEHRKHPACSDGQVVTIKQSEYKALLSLRKEHEDKYTLRHYRECLEECEFKLAAVKTLLAKAEEKARDRAMRKGNLERDLERKMLQVYRRGKQIRRRDREIRNLRKILENRGTLADYIKKSGEYTDTSSVSSDAISDSSKEEEEEEEEEEVVEEESKSKKVTYV